MNEDNFVAYMSAEMDMTFWASPDFASDHHNLMPYTYPESYWRLAQALKGGI